MTKKQKKTLYRILISAVLLCVAVLGTAGRDYQTGSVYCAVCGDRLAMCCGKQFETLHMARYLMKTF